MKEIGRVAAALTLVLGLRTTAAIAGNEHEMPQTLAGSAQLQQVKRLAGRWEGTSQQEGAAEEPAAEYRVTSGGSAVVETLFPGTPHEMVSVYHDGRDGKLTMTHYCMLGNQPELVLVGSSDQQLELSLAPGSPIPPAEQHMHALTIAWTDSDHLTQAWTCHKDGTADSSVTIRLSRVR